tara:strand:+ start:688 stop:1191 length:504 start_codon:yes stop_codon:yes gene_type:complete
MSSRYLSAPEPNLDQNLRVYSAVVKENMIVEGEAQIDGKLAVGSSFAAGSLRLLGTGKVTYPALVNYTQLTSEVTPVTITGAEEQFQISTATGANINPGTTRLFTVNHASVSTSTMVLLSRADGVAQQLLTWVAYVGAGTIRVALHNLSTVAATGQETIILKLIHFL